MTKRVAILTSGGDAPGMNAAIRSSVRLAKAQGWTVYGIRRGYSGLINNEIEELGLRSVSNILQRGGTILKTSRSQEFHTESGMQKAASHLENLKIDYLILIGGDGTFRGALEFSRYWKGQVIGIPGTIDNDVYGTDMTIGFHTAVHTAVEALDKIRDTADAYERIFVVEVMGRSAGHIALHTAIAGGAEEMLIPEVKHNLQELALRLTEGKKRGKTSSIVVVAEGNSEGNAYEIADKLKALCGEEFRVVVLGYLQRGGAPVPEDRILATKLGSFAVYMLNQGKSGCMVGEVKNELITTSFEETLSKKKSIDQYLERIAIKIAI